MMVRYGPDGARRCGEVVLWCGGEVRAGGGELVLCKGEVRAEGGELIWYGGEAVW